MALTLDIPDQGRALIDPDKVGGPMTYRLPDTSNYQNDRSIVIQNVTTSATTFSLTVSTVSATDKIQDPNALSSLVGTVTGLSLPNYGSLYFVLIKNTDIFPSYAVWLYQYNNI